MAKVPDKPDKDVLADLEANSRCQRSYPNVRPRNSSIRDKPIQKEIDHESKSSTQDSYHGIPEEVAV